MKNWLIAKPLPLLAALLFLVTVALWLVPVWLGMNTVRQSTDILLQNGAITQSLMDVRMHESLFVFDEAERPEFHEKGGSARLVAHGKATDLLENHIAELGRMLGPAKQESVAQLLAGVRAYRAAFSGVVEAMRQQGFKDWGLEGRWRRAAHVLEIEFPPSRAPFYADVLQLRRNEKDYLLRREEQYSRIVDSYLESLRSKAETLPAARRAAALALIAEYQASFREFRALDRKLGRLNGPGLLQAMRAARQALEPAVAAFSADAALARQSSATQVRWVVALTSLILGGLVAGALLQFVRIQQHQRELARTEEIRKASENKSRFMAGVSHELRNPLSSILGFTDLLEEQCADRLSESERRHLAHIRKSGHHMLHLVNDIMDLSRLEVGKMQLRRMLVEVRSILQEVLPAVEVQRAEKNLHVHVALKSDVELYADPVRFKQILLNLMGNAVKFTPDGGTVEVGLHSANGVACLYVRDTGPGIRAEDQARVFEEYYQGTEGKESRVGSGLGLAITRRLVEEHGGKIWVKSGPGSGTEFLFTMPRTATV